MSLQNELTEKYKLAFSSGHATATWGRCMKVSKYFGQPLADSNTLRQGRQYDIQLLKPTNGYEGVKISTERQGRKDKLKRPWCSNDRRHFIDITRPVTRPEEEDSHADMQVYDTPYFARQIVTRFFQGEKLNRLLYHDGCMYVFNGSFWEEPPTKEFAVTIWKHLEVVIAEFNSSGLLSKPILITLSFRDCVLESLKANSRTEKIPGTWLIDADKRPPVENLLIFKNCIVDLAKFVEHDPTYKIPHDGTLFNLAARPFDFDPSAPPPKRFLRLLSELWADKDANGIVAEHLLLQDIFGSTLTKNSYQKAALLSGASRGCKTTLALLCLHLNGCPECVIDFHKLGVERFALQVAVGKFGILFNETIWPKGDHPAWTTYCRVVSREGVPTDRKFLPSITYSDWGFTILVSNPLPDFLDDSGRILNRWVILKFTRSFKGREDTKLLDTLKNEIPGILLWAIEGWARLRKNAAANKPLFTEPKSSQHTMDLLESNCSPLKTWAMKFCKFDFTFSAKEIDLYADFKTWCDLHNYVPPVTHSAFGLALLNAFPDLTPVKGPDNSMTFDGLRLLGSQEVEKTHANH